jgi:hypothetical protein
VWGCVKIRAKSHEKNQDRLNGSLNMSLRFVQLLRLSNIDTDSITIWAGSLMLFGPELQVNKMHMLRSFFFSGAGVVVLLFNPPHPSAEFSGSELWTSLQ